MKIDEIGHFANVMESTFSKHLIGDKKDFRRIVKRERSVESMNVIKQGKVLTFV